MMGDNRFNLGNVVKSGGFKSVWMGEKRRKLIKYMNTFNPKNCRENCRMEECNRYLSKVVGGCEHKEFI